MVNNYRELCEKHTKNSTINYSDEELFKVINYWSGMSSPQEEEEAIVSDVNNLVKY